MLSEQAVRDMRQGFLDSMEWEGAGRYMKHLQFVADLLTTVLEEDLPPDDTGPERMTLYQSVLGGMGALTRLFNHF